MKLTDVIFFSLFTPRMPYVTRPLEFLVLWRKYIIPCTVDGSDFIILFPLNNIWYIRGTVYDVENKLLGLLPCFFAILVIAQ